MNPLYLQLRDELDQVELGGRERDIIVAVLNRSIRWGKPSVRLTRGQLKALAGIHGKDELRPIADLVRKGLLLIEETAEGTRYTVDPNPDRWRVPALVSAGDRRRLDEAIALANGWDQPELDFVAVEPTLSSLIASATVSASQCSDRVGVEQVLDSTPGVAGRRPGDWFAAMKDAARSGVNPLATQADSTDSGFGCRSQGLSEERAPSSAALAEVGRPIFGQPDPENRASFVPENRGAENQALPTPKIGQALCPKIGPRKSGTEVPDLQLPENRAGTAIAKALAPSEKLKLKLSSEAPDGPRASWGQRETGLLSEVQRECPRGWDRFREAWRRLIAADPDYVEFSLLRRLRNERREGKNIESGAAWMSRIARDEGLYVQTNRSP